jgi:transmembrane sensor
VNSRVAMDISTEHAIRAWTGSHSGTWSAADEAQLRAWLDADPEHRAAYDRVGRLWGLAGQLPGGLRSVSSRRPWGPRRILAASCAAVLIAAVLVPAWRAGQDWWNGVPVRWSADRGAPKSFLLNDGTQVMLDADSELVARVGARVRRVTLIRGEALFTVVHDTSRPFEVDVGAGRIADFGTRFDVERVHNSVRIAVLEGRVGIATLHGEMSLGAGSGSGYDGEGTLLPVRPIDESVALWGEGQRRFNAEPLSDVVDRLMRYHSVTFFFTDPRLKELRVSGTFKMGDLALFLRTLAAALPVEARWTAPQHIEISSRPGVANQRSSDR